MPPKRPAAGPSAAGGKALIGLLGLAVGLAVGYGAGRVSTGTPINPLAPSQEQAPNPDQDVAQRLRDAGLLPPTAEESTALSGKATAVTATSLSFEADVIPFDPSGEKHLPVRRTATLTADTVIVRLVEKTPQEITAENQAYAKITPDPNSPPPAPPSAYKEVPIEATDIAVGETVTVEAATDILKAETFEAVRVTVAPSSAPTSDGTPPSPENGGPGPAPALPTPPEDPNRPASPPAAPQGEAPRI